MKCPKCTKEIPDQSVFCSFCGSPVESKSCCPKCGAELPEEAIYCLNCGTRLSRTPVPQPAPQPVPQPAPRPTPTITERSVTVAYKTGSNTMLGTNTFGKLTVSSAGITYKPSFTLSSKQVNHSYGFADVLSTEFKWLRAGLQPQMGYRVTLKNGTVHDYVYGIMEKSALEQIDSVIKSQIRS